MRDKITAEELPALFSCVSAEMNACADELCEMDAKMGDGDLGLTMKKGFAALPQLIEESGEADLGKKLMKAGMKMASVVPSTMGTLMASGVMAGGKELAGLTEIDAAAYLKYLTGFAAGIAKRGKCERGQRTVLDAIGPAADEVARALNETPALTLAQAARLSLEGAERGLRETADMEPVFGKAAVHKNVARGVVDQGACAAVHMIRGYCAYLCNEAQ